MLADYYRRCAHHIIVPAGLFPGLVLLDPDLRIQVFQQEAFNPPLSQILISAVLLIWLAVRLRVSQSLRNTPVLNQPM